MLLQGLSHKMLDNTVTRYGAVGNLVHDDTEAFQEAINAHKRVYVPEPPLGYIITDTIIVPDGHEFVGVGGSGHETTQASLILFKGTGTKSYVLSDIEGTSIANPATGDPYLADSGTRGNTYGLSDYTTNFSVGIILGKGSKLTNVTLYPYFDGIEGYKGTTSALGDNWDVGIWCRNADRFNLINVQCLGHWRKSGLLVTATDIDDSKVPSSELGLSIGSHFQGHRGLSIRSPNEATGTNYGFAGTTFINTRFQSFDHQSGHLCTSSFLATPLSKPSAVMELSGSTLRGVKFIACTHNGLDDINIIFDDVNEIDFIGCYGESKNIKIAGVLQDPVLEGSRIIATENTVGVRFIGNTKYALDFAPMQTRESRVTRYADAGGVTEPNTMYDDDYSSRLLNSYTGLRLRTPTDAYIISNSDDDEVFKITGAGNVVTTGSVELNQNLLATLDTFNLYRTVADVAEYVMRVFSTGNVSFAGVVAPLTDDAYTLGGASNRWSQVFATNGTINTSDAREKQQVLALTVKEKAVALKLKALIKTYKFNSSVKAKGDKARKHIGLIAQQVQEAFISEGLDGFDYGILCYDKWEANEETEVEAGERYGLRYDELTLFILGAI